eukprot:Filipodium_phascolosomae@DN2567_c0_g1_i11.p1
MKAIFHIFQSILLLLFANYATGQSGEADLPAPKLLWQPIHYGGYPVKAGQTSRFVNIVFEAIFVFNPFSTLVLTVPEGYAFTNPDSCFEATSLAYHTDGMPLIPIAAYECKAVGRTARFKIGPYNPRPRFELHFILGTKLDFPLIAPEDDRFIFVHDHHYRRYPTMYLAGGVIQAVKGSSMTKEAGGDEREAVMRPKELLADTQAEVSVHLELTDPLQKDGAMVVSLPAGFRLPTEDCGAIVLNCSSKPCVQESDWECTKKDSNRISLKRLSTPSASTLQVKLQVISSSVVGLAGQTTIVTCKS